MTCLLFLHSVTSNLAPPIYADITCVRCLESVGDIELSVRCKSSCSLHIGNNSFKLILTHIIFLIFSMGIPYAASRFDQKTLLNFCADLYRFIRQNICNHLGEFYDPYSELVTYGPQIRKPKRVRENML